MEKLIQNSGRTILGENKINAKYTDEIAQIIIMQRETGVMENRQLAELHDTTQDYISNFVRLKWKHLNIPMAEGKSKGSGPKSGTSTKLSIPKVMEIINNKLYGMSLIDTANASGVSKSAVKCYWKKYIDNDRVFFNQLKEYNTKILDAGEYNVIHIASEKKPLKWEKRKIVVENHYFTFIKTHYNTIKIDGGYYDFPHDLFLKYNKII